MTDGVQQVYPDSHLLWARPNTSSALHYQSNPVSVIIYTSTSIIHTHTHTIPRKQASYNMTYNYTMQ